MTSTRFATTGPPKTARRPAHSSKNISLEELTAHFHLPINDVAKKLGLCVTVLKQRCRANGISRWPYRKVRKLDNYINALETPAPQEPLPREPPPAQWGMGHQPMVHQQQPAPQQENGADRLEQAKDTRNFLLANPNSTVHLAVGRVKTSRRKTNEKGGAKSNSGIGHESRKHFTDTASSSGHVIDPSAPEQHPTLHRPVSLQRVASPAVSGGTPKHDGSMIQRPSTAPPDVNFPGAWNDGQQPWLSLNTTRQSAFRPMERSPSFTGQPLHPHGGPQAPVAQAASHGAQHHNQQVSQYQQHQQGYSDDKQGSKASEHQALPPPSGSVHVDGAHEPPRPQSTSPPMPPTPPPSMSAAMYPFFAQMAANPFLAAYGMNNSSGNGNAANMSAMFQQMSQNPQMAQMMMAMAAASGGGMFGPAGMSQMAEMAQKWDGVNGSANGQQQAQQPQQQAQQPQQQQPPPPQQQHQPQQPQQPVANSSGAPASSGSAAASSNADMMQAVMQAAMMQSLAWQQQQQPQPQQPAAYPNSSVGQQAMQQHPHASQQPSQQPQGNGYPCSAQAVAGSSDAQQMAAGNTQHSGGEDLNWGPKQFQGHHANMQLGARC